MDFCKSLAIYFLAFLLLQLVVIATAGKVAPAPLHDKEFKLDAAVSADYNSTYRLPQTIVPTLYKIELRPILDEVEGSPDVFQTAPGKVTIDLHCNGATNNITLHSRTIVINAESIQLNEIPGGAPVQIATKDYKVEDDTYVITLGDNLTPNANYRLEISYVANMDGKDGLNGIYRAYYVDQNNQTHNIAATHMEPTRARKAFPCFDEPGFKTPFEVTLGRLKKYNSLSNTMINRTIDIPNMTDWVWDIYHPTPPMPTYLVAAVVSDLKSETAQGDVFDKPVKVWATEQLIDAGGGKYGAAIAAQTLKYFQDDLKLPQYELPKMDSAAIPQFSPGAMENWGLNLYRENLLLTLDGISSEFERHDVANVIAHELAHQWFGNLVTCKWWSDIWLNEGFATYWSYEAEQVTGPEFGPSRRFFTENIKVALENDILPTTHPIHNPSLETVNVSPLFFDRIAYEKAGSVIRMFDRLVTGTLFTEGLKKYLVEILEAG